MTRLPYGTFKTLTPEERKAHLRELSKKSRLKRREKLHEENRRYHELWKITKPFECICIKCGNKFNACKYNRKVCPDCHTKARNNRINMLAARAVRVAAQKAKVAKIPELRKDGLTHAQISSTLGVSIATVGRYLKMADMSGKLKKRAKS